MPYKTPQAFTRREGGATHIQTKNISRNQLIFTILGHNVQYSPALIRSVAILAAERPPNGVCKAQLRLRILKKKIDEAAAEQVGKYSYIAPESSPRKQSSEVPIVSLK